MKNLFAFAAALAMVPTAAYSHEIDFTRINTVLAAITSEVLKAEQTKDKDGKDLLDFLNFTFDPKASNLEEGKISFGAGAGLNSSAWAKGTKSSLNFTIKGETKLSGVTPVMEATAKATLNTEMTALIRYAHKQIVKAGDPCKDHTGSTPEEKAFIKDACAEFDKLGTVTKFEEVATALENLSKLSAAYYEKDPSAKPYADAFVAGFEKRKAPGSDGSVEVVYKEPINLFGTGSDITQVTFSLKPNAFSFGLTVTSPESVAVLQQYRKDIETFAEKLERADSDAEKKELTADITQNLRSLISLAKGVILDNGTP